MQINPSMNRPPALLWLLLLLLLLPTAAGRVLLDLAGGVVLVLIALPLLLTGVGWIGWKIQPTPGSQKSSVQPLSSLLQAVCAGYRPNPYHNFQHAVSVLHVSYLLHRAGPPNVEGNDQPPVVLSKLELLALFLAALGHDIDHPGVTNAFLCNSYAPLALCYNDESVLENHHAATTWTLLNDSRNDVLGGLAVEERKTVRNLIIKSILATDMAHHSHMVKHLTELAADHKPIEVMDVLTTVLHLAQDVHMALFVATLLYYTLMWFTLATRMRWLEGYERLEAGAPPRDPTEHFAMRQVRRPHPASSFRTPHTLTILLTDEPTVHVATRQLEAMREQLLAAVRSEPHLQVPSPPP